jgi:hypothetical protein
MNGGTRTPKVATAFPEAAVNSVDISQPSGTKVSFADSIFIPLVFGITGNVGLGRFPADTALSKASRGISMAG